MRKTSHFRRGKASAITCRDRLRDFQWHDGIEFSGFVVLGLGEEMMMLQAHPIFGFLAEIVIQLQALPGSEQAAAGEGIIEQLRACVKIRSELRLEQSVEMWAPAVSIGTTWLGRTGAPGKNARFHPKRDRAVRYWFRKLDPKPRK